MIMVQEIRKPYAAPPCFLAPALDTFKIENNLGLWQFLNIIHCKENSVSIFLNDLQMPGGCIQRRPQSFVAIDAYFFYCLGFRIGPDQFIGTKNSTEDIFICR